MEIEANTHPALKQFIAELHEIVEQGGDEQSITQSVAEKMKILLGNKNVLPQQVMQPNKDHYVMYPVYVAPDDSFSIASAVWGVNQTTPIHDHGTWGVIGIVQGSELEIRYQRDEMTQSVLWKDESIIQENDVVVCCTSDQDVHKVACASNIPCVGIHVYGGNIGEIERRSYHPETNQVKTFVSRWAAIPQ